VARRAALAAGLLALVTVLPVVGPSALVTCATAQSGELHVGVVVDFGALAGQGAPSAPQSSCIPVDSRTNGFQMLQAAGHHVTVNSSNLLCTIDGFPDDGTCANQTGSGSYRYWAYFHGTAAGWSYSGVGPGSFRTSTPEVEGWHFVDSKEMTAPPPGGPSDPAAICGATEPPTAPAPTAAPNDPPPTSPPARPGASPTTASASAPPSSASGNGAQVAGASNRAGATTTTGPDAAGGNGSGADGSASAGDTIAPGDGTDRAQPTEVAAGTRVSDAAVVQAVPAGATHGGPTPLVIVVVVAIAALLVGTAWRARRTSDRRAAGDEL
jgi:hypothetical protein